MRRHVFGLVVAVLLAWAASPGVVSAQTGTPPAGPTGEVTGEIINVNRGALVTESLEVMLHIWDEDYVDMGMLYGQSEPDGTLRFAEVALETGRLYAVMAIYGGVTYFSEVVPAESGEERLELNLRVG